MVPAFNVKSAPRHPEKIYLRRTVLLNSAKTSSRHDVFFTRDMTMLEYSLKAMLDLPVISFFCLL